MPKEDLHRPRAFHGVMVSSTFVDLVEHRAALIQIIERRGLKAIPMEYDAALPAGDVIDSSLAKVRDGSAYVGIIAKRYGQIPPCPRRNPGKVSITELEFDEAVKLKRPILLFFMGKDHLVRESDIEADPANKEKLKAFGERAKEMGPDNQVHRVYATFESLEDFKEKAAQSVDALHRYLDELDRVAAEPCGAPPEPAATEAKSGPDPIPRPPDFYAEPAYLGSHEFVGRRDQLETLNEWALPADSHPVLLFEAIGGTGKSMLTWEWVRNHAPAVRKEGTKDAWAGRFWYSFYERGAIMADFCSHALAYMTGQPLAELEKKKTPELVPLLLRQLQSRPWLLVLDGLERVLVAYHRIDAAQLRDEEAGQSDAIAQRDPCTAIRPEDDDLLRLLATAAPSKLLLTSRLIPRVLLNAASQPVPGVLRERLPGLRPADAEALLRACGIKGDSTAIRSYLKEQCGCHPLATGALAGLVTHYLPARGDFDKWWTAADGGERLDIADIDLVQKRNHILKASITDLPQDSHRLLSMIALLSEAVDFETLQALNPFMPPEINEVPVPQKPDQHWRWGRISDKRKEELKRNYATAVQRRAEYEQAVQARRQSSEFLAAPERLAQAIENLEKRGLLQYDPQAGHYDLHPVVRAIVAGGLRSEERETLGQRVVDYFSARPRNPYEHAETLEDVRDGLRVVRTLVQLGHFSQAYEAYRGDLARALLFNLEANAETLALLRPFFPDGWSTLPIQVDKCRAGYLANAASLALGELGQKAEQLAALGSALGAYLELKDWENIRVGLNNLWYYCVVWNRLAKADLCGTLNLDVATLRDDLEDLFRARLDRFSQFALMGRWPDAEAIWRSLETMGFKWNRGTYRPGFAEWLYARARFWRRRLSEDELARAERMARKGRNRQVIRYLRGLRGEWQMQQQQWRQAAKSLQEAVRMARTVGQYDAAAEAQLALARFHLGEDSDPNHTVEQLCQASRISDFDVARFWLALGNRERAREHALKAYQRAWSDGEPYVHRYHLNEARALLEQLGSEIPNLPPYDPAKDEKLPWEDTVRAAIEELRAEKAAKAAKKAEEEAGKAAEAAAAEEAAKQATQPEPPAANS